jgi:hypothetical protein
MGTLLGQELDYRGPDLKAPPKLLTLKCSVIWGTLLSATPGSQILAQAKHPSLAIYP